MPILQSHLFSGRYMVRKDRDESNLTSPKTKMLTPAICKKTSNHVSRRSDFLGSLQNCQRGFALRPLTTTKEIGFDLAGCVPSKCCVLAMEEQMWDVHVEKIGDVAIIRCEGRMIGSDAAFKLRDEVRRQRNSNFVLLDLSELN